MVSPGSERLDRLLQRGGGLRGAARLARGVGPAGQDLGAVAVPGRCQLQCLRVALLGRGDVEPDGPVAGPDQEPPGGVLQGDGLLDEAGRPGEVEGRRVVVGQDLGQVVDPLPRHSLGPGRRGPVLGAPRGPRDLPVADVADQRVPEGEFGLAVDRGDRLGPNQLLAGEFVEGLSHRAFITAADGRDRARPEHLPDDGGVLEHGLARRGQGVQAGRDQRMDRLRNPDVGALGQTPGALIPHQQGLVLEHPDELLCVERVPARPFEQQVLDVLGKGRPVEQRRHQPGSLVLRQGMELDPSGVAGDGGPAGVALGELGTGGADEQHREPVRVLHEVPDEREHRLVGPVDVLEHEHGRTGRGDGLEEPPPRGEQLLPLCGRGGLYADQGSQPLLQPLPVRLGFRDRRVELGDGFLRRVGLQDPGLSLHDLAERPERDPLSVRQAPAQPPRDAIGQGLDMPRELGDQAALPDPRLAHHRGQLHRGVPPGPGEGFPQGRHFRLPTDQRGAVRPGQPGGEPSPGRRPP